jgi:hypothetical protein
MERHRLAQQARHELAQPLGGIVLRRVDQVAHKRRSGALFATTHKPLCYFERKKEKQKKKNKEK